jgi:hypothetical protein
MKNTIGNASTLDDFYPRPREIERIYRGLEDGNNLYLSAPRRVGKTSIMLHLCEKPRKGYVFVYDDYESCVSSDKFFERLCKTILQSPIHLKRGGRIKTKVQSLKEKFEGFSLEALSMKLEVKAQAKTDWMERLQLLFSELSVDGERLVIMIDEFPQVVLHILNNEGPEAAAQFLHQHRELRQSPQSKQNVAFIYTGSISLHHIVSLTADIKTVNDFDYVYVEPLERDEAIDMASKILKGSKRIPAPEQLAYLVDRIEWLIPFHIKLVLKEILDRPLKEGAGITAESVQEAFDSLLHRKNKPDIRLYFSRLSNTYEGNERKFVFKVLQLAAGEAAPTYAQLADIATHHDCLDRCADILDALEMDGYLTQKMPQATYVFRSPILKFWWLKHESRKH